MRTREAVLDLSEGRLSSPAAREELVNLVMFLIVAEGLEVEVRDTEDAFNDESGRLLLSKTLLSELRERLWADYREFARCDLSEYEIVYIFVDGIAERIRFGQKREPVLVAWGITSEGKKILLHFMAGSKGDAKAVSTFFQDMRNRGFGDSLLVVPDGASSIIKAIESCLLRSERQRWLAHRLRNLAVKVPEDQWPEVKVRVTAAYQAPLRNIARDLAENVVEDYGVQLPSAVACFQEDFEAAPEDAGHPPSSDPDRDSPRTVFPQAPSEIEGHNAFREKPILKLIFGNITRPTERWRANQGHRLRAPPDGRRHDRIGPKLGTCNGLNNLESKVVNSDKLFLKIDLSAIHILCFQYHFIIKIELQPIEIAQLFLYQPCTV